MKSVIYTRVSSKEQVDKYSLTAQEKILTECIAKEGHELIGIYTDAGISGKRIVDRPEFQKLLLDAEEKNFQAVWVIDQDRLSRGDLADLAYIKRVFKENNIQLGTPYQKLSLEDVDDDFISDLFGILAKRERLKILQRANRGRQIKAEKGELGGRTAPFGYSFDIEKNKHLVVNEKESPIYRQIISLFLTKNYGIKRISAELNKQGFRNRAGKPWRMQAIHYILRSPTYKGTLVHQKFKFYYTKENKRRWRDEKIFTEIPKAHPALISEETFDLIQEKLKKKRNSRVDSDSLQLLTGILECSSCHNTFKVGSTSFGKWRRVIYRCKTRYAHWFDKSKPTCTMKTFPLMEYNDKVWNTLQEIARMPDRIKKALEKSSAPNLNDLELYQKEYKQVIQKLDNFNSYKDNAVSLRIRGIINEEEFKTQLISLTEEKRSLEQQKRELEIKIEFFKRAAAEGINQESILRYAKFIYQSDKKLTISQKRRILEGFVSRVPIYSNGEFELVLKFPLPYDSQLQELQLTTNSSIDGRAAG
jgi:site-specific DNA recombinase